MPKIEGLVTVRGLVAAAVFGWACACGGQAPVERRGAAVQDGPIATLHAEARLVNITVNAVDSAGAPVSGLIQADFSLAEDGKPQKIVFFEKDSSTPLSIVLAVDGSESVLTNERLEKTAGKKFVDTLLRPQDEFDLMEFDDTVREIVSFTNDKKRIESGLSDLGRGDATAVYDAVYLASQRLGETKQDAGRRRVLVLITDGDNTVKGVRYDEAVAQAQKAGVMVYALIVVPIAADAGRNTGGEHALIQMANDTGGKYYYVEDPKELGPAFQKVSDDLRTQYVLGYYAPERTAKNRADGFRAVEVTVTDPAMAGKVSLRYRTGYYAAR
jgi:Ca-activated chloride channel family protein